MFRSAHITSDGRFRLELAREWDARKQKICFLMLNPSIADGLVDDPTIVRDIGFAARNGFGGILVGNLFPYRATSPKELLRVYREAREGRRAVLGGAENDYSLRQMIRRVDVKVVCAAWGRVHPELEWRIKEVRRLLEHRVVKNKVRIFGLTQGGQPRHPLYLKSNTELVRWGALC